MRISMWKYLLEELKAWFHSLTKRQNHIFYIGGSDVLPPPLSVEEEKKCLEALVKEQSEEAEKTLISHNLRLVVYLARKFENTGIGRAHV